MSETTRRAVEESIRAHLAAECDEPVIVTDWTVLTAYQGMDDEVTGYFYIARIGMAAHTFTGLIRHHLRVFEYQHLMGSIDGGDE